MKIYKKKFTMVGGHEGMEPIAIIDDVKYVCMLEQPRMINIPILPAFYANSFGFRWVYIYKYGE